MSFQTTGPEHYCNQGYLMAPAPRWSGQHHPGVWPLCCPIHIPPHASYHVGSCPPLPNRWGRSRVAVQCPLLCPELGDGTRGLTPGLALRAGTGGGVEPSRSGPSRCCSWTPLPEQEGGHPGRRESGQGCGGETWFY